MSKPFESMLRYAARRCVVALPTLWLIVTVMFLLVQMAPGDPATFIAGEGDISDEYLAQVRSEYGLDKPVLVQYGVYLSKVIRGDLGYSFRYRAPVLGLIAERVPATLLLMLIAIGLFAIIGVLLGAAAARRQYSSFDLGLVVLSVCGWSIPIFWFGQMLLIVFALTLRWFPTQGMFDLRSPSYGIGRFIDALYHAVLPVTALGMRFMALNARMMRTSMIEALSQDYITTARSKGLTEAEVMRYHAIPNALLPVVTLVGMNIGTMLAGSVLTEVVFGWPGMGRLLYDGIYSRDYPLVIGIILVMAIAVVVCNLITDIVYAFIDPRIRYD
ncbi:MAG: ABC transporter permease [Bacillota bacterium]|jgi:ABC-type dipeptide/oligopeptide/nickel transport system permease component